MSRGGQKHEREAVQAIERAFPGTKATVELRRGSVGHKWLVVSLGGVIVRTTISSSPGIDPGTLQHFLRRNIKHAFAEKGVSVETLHATRAK